MLNIDARTDDKLKHHKAKSRSRGEGGVEEPEVSCGPGLEEAADFADHRVGGKKGQVVKADDGRVDRFRRILREQGEAYGQHVGEADAVEEVERDGPGEADLRAG